MTLDFTWHIPNRIAHVRFQTEITTAHLTTINDNFIAAYQHHPYPIHEIITLDPSTAMQINALEIKKITPYISHPQMGWLVVYGQLNKPLRFMGVFMSNLTPIRIKIVDTLEDAFAFLKEQDQTIPWEPQNAI